MIRLAVVTVAMLWLGRPLNAQGPSGGTGTIYYGTYDKKILIIDEATMAVADSMPVSVGIPIGLTLSVDRKKMYAIDPAFEWVEIFDLATRKATSKFTLSTEGKRVRLAGFNIDPLDRFAIIVAKTYEKKSDQSAMLSTGVGHHRY